MTSEQTRERLIEANICVSPKLELVQCIQCRLLDAVKESEVTRWYETHQCKPKQLDLAVYYRTNSRHLRIVK